MKYKSLYYFFEEAATLLILKYFTSLLLVTKFSERPCVPFSVNVEDIIHRESRQKMTPQTKIIQCVSGNFSINEGQIYTMWLSEMENPFFCNIRWNLQYPTHIFHSISHTGKTTTAAIYFLPERPRG